MHEFHAWIGLAESTEEGDDDKLLQAVNELKATVATADWHDAVFSITNLNGQYFLTATGFINRQRAEGEFLDGLLAFTAERLPGSWGMIYDRDDEMPSPPGPNGFRVRVLTRGAITERRDPFLSPCNPTIED